MSCAVVWCWLLTCVAWRCYLMSCDVVWGFRMTCVALRCYLKSCIDVWCLLMTCVAWRCYQMSCVVVWCFIWPLLHWGAILCVVLWSDACRCPMLLQGTTWWPHIIQGLKSWCRCWRVYSCDSDALMLLFFLPLFYCKIHLVWCRLGCIQPPKLNFIKLYIKILINLVSIRIH